MVLQQMFVDLKLHDIILLFPRQMNNELYLHLKSNLKNKIEKKCIDVGYVCKINEIIDYKNGYLLPEDLTGNVTFKVVYSAKMCVPIIDTQIVMKIDQIFKSVLMCVNGPVSGIVKFTDINTNLFTINNSGNIIYKKTNKTLSINDHVKVTIKSKRTYTGDKNVGIVGYIDDVATKEVVDLYMYKEYEDDEDDLKPYDSKFIEMNEDDAINEGIEPIKPKGKVENYVMDI
jgi:DNA-directed RNA polymerase subunit E'/Rpb7